MKPMMDSPDGRMSVAGWSDADGADGVDGADSADGVTGGAADVTSLFTSVTQHKVWLPMGIKMYTATITIMWKIISLFNRHGTKSMNRTNTTYIIYIYNYKCVHTYM